MASTVPNNEATQFKAGEEQVEIARKGGIASGEAKREKKAMRQMLQECLNMTNNKGQSFQELATLGLIKGAMSGKAMNYRVILETLGELEAPKNNDNGVLADLVEAIKNASKKD